MYTRSKNQTKIEPICLGSKYMVPDVFHFLLFLHVIWGVVFTYSQLTTSELTFSQRQPTQQEDPVVFEPEAGVALLYPQGDSAES